jgi:hypothetical protein
MNKPCPVCKGNRVLYIPVELKPGKPPAGLYVTLPGREGFHLVRNCDTCDHAGFVPVDEGAPACR